MKKDGNTKQLTVLVDIDELKEFQSAWALLHKPICKGFFSDIIFK